MTNIKYLLILQSYFFGCITVIKLQKKASSTLPLDYDIIQCFAKWLCLLTSVIAVYSQKIISASQVNDIIRFAHFLYTCVLILSCLHHFALDFAEQINSIHYIRRYTCCMENINPQTSVSYDSRSAMYPLVFQAIQNRYFRCLGMLHQVQLITYIH